MSDTELHVQEKVREALAATAYDRHDALRLLMTWAVRDPVLLLGMTKPYLRGIASARIEQHMSRLNQPAEPEPGPAESGEPGAPVVEKRTASHIPPPKSSPQQAEVMRQLIEAYRKKS